MPIRILATSLPIVLHPDTLPGGLVAHNRRDRALIDALPQTPPLVNADGTVLETGGATRSPPRTDGRILPGTSLPPSLEADLTLDDLRETDNLIVSSSLAGVVPAVLAGARQSRLALRS